MKLNEEQIETLENRVSLSVTYRETYQEVYDHILTGLEKDNTKDLDTAIDIIIDNDFGGNSGLREMEKFQAEVVRKQIRNKHREYMLDCFKWPSIILTVVLTGLMYYFLNNADTSTAIRNSVGAITYLPFVFIIIMALLNMYFLGGEKRSIKYSEIYNIAGMGYIAYIIVKAVLKYVFNAHQTLLLQHLNNGLTSTAFVLLLVYTLAFFRLYKNEFKMQLT
jgi:hypothetical protein